MIREMRTMVSTETQSVKNQVRHLADLANVASITKSTGKGQSFEHKKFRIKVFDFYTVGTTRRLMNAADKAEWPQLAHVDNIVNSVKNVNKPFAIPIYYCLLKSVLKL